MVDVCVCVYVSEYGFDSNGSKSEKKLRSRVEGIAYYSCSIKAAATAQR